MKKISQAIILLFIIFFADAANAGSAKIQLHEEPIVAPVADFLDIEGNKRNLKELRGKFILVNFWATWCPPCIVEMPGLIDYANSRNISLVAISTDKRKKSQVIDFVNAKDWKIQTYFDNGSSMMTNAQINGLPSTLIISPDGEEIARITGSLDWNDENIKNELDKLIK